MTGTMRQSHSPHHLLTIILFSFDINFTSCAHAFINPCASPATRKKCPTVSEYHGMQRRELSMHLHRSVRCSPRVTDTGTWCWRLLNSKSIVQPCFCNVCITVRDAHLQPWTLQHRASGCQLHGQPPGFPGVQRSHELGCEWQVAVDDTVLYRRKRDDVVVLLSGPGGSLSV
jgi:hypothetical protein